MTKQNDPDDDPAQAEDPAVEILKIGERLTAALSAEEQLARQLSNDPDDRVVLEQWRKARRSVDDLGQRYSVLIAGPNRGPEPRDVVLRALAGHHAAALRMYTSAEQTALGSTAKFALAFRELRIARLTMRWLQNRIAQLIAIKTGRARKHIKQPPGPNH
jgi:hypothetical protein